MTAPAWNVMRLLATTAEFLGKKGSESARLDAELLLGRVLGMDRVKLYCAFDRPLVESELGAYRDLVRRRAAGEPVAYILGAKEFYGRTFEVGPAVLVPRPETEHLADAALDRIPKDAPRRVIDVGTGSGVIAVTIACERPDADATATDISGEALAVAVRNAAKHGVGRIRFLSGDLFAGETGPFDLVCSNPPYIDLEAVNTLPKDVVNFEPHQALFANDGGMAVVRRLIENAPAVLAAGGYLIMEIGEGQAHSAREIAERVGKYDSVSFVSDYAGKQRVLVARVKG